jgi:predicted ABC-type ATPase
MKVRLINVRGCNGSGKTTVVRSLNKDGMGQVGYYTVPDHKPIPLTFVNPGPHDKDIVVLVGDYLAQGCSGLDRIKTQAAAKSIIELAAGLQDVRAVVFEGVLVSTIFEPWLQWSRAHGGMTWAFLSTPIETCLSRIQARNGGKPIKEEQVRDKHKGIARISLKANLAGERVIVLPWLDPTQALVDEIYRE